MFSLIKYDNGEFSILPSHRIKVIAKKECRVKYKGTTYSATILKTSDSEEELILKKKKLEKGVCQPSLVSSPIDTMGTRTQRHRVSKLKPQTKNLRNRKNDEKRKRQDNTKKMNKNIDTSQRSPIGLNTRNEYKDNSNSFSSGGDRAGVDVSDLSEIIRENSLINISIDSSINKLSIDVLNEDNMNIKEKRKNMDRLNLSCPKIMSNKSNKDDSDYFPSQNASISEISMTSTVQSDMSSTISEIPADIDIRGLKIPLSKVNSQITSKKHFCMYCNTLQTKFARHLILQHKNEEDVKNVISLPINSRERKKAVEVIRKQGDYLHNTSEELNTGILISCRRNQEGKEKSVEDFIACTECKGFFSKSTFRIHYRNCNKSHKKGVRDMMSSGKRLTGFSHKLANEVLRRKVFPVMREDEVLRCIKYDPLIILYGNKLSDKYTLDHQQDMIRAHLRLLGRFKLTMMSLDETITDFASIIKPQKFDCAISALRQVANWDSELMWFKTPAVAQNLTTIIKKVAHKLRSESIKSQNTKQKQDIEDFLLLWAEETPVIINKKAAEDQILQKRQKKVVLPSKNDIKLLFEYLKKHAQIALHILEKKFDSGAWRILNETSLIMIQIFNRRRAGEIERLKLTDYQGKEKLDENLNKEICENLSKETIKYACQFYRLTVRGKLNRTVPVLLSPFATQCLDTLIKHRKRAGVKDNNEYVFSVPFADHLKKKYLRACPLLRKFSKECGAFIPDALRGTTLRKHIATFTAMLHIEESQVDKLANFMGHDKDIHKSIYRVPVPIAEVTDVSKLLLAAMGGDDYEEKSDEENGNNSDNSSDDEQVDCISNNAISTNESTVIDTSLNNVTKKRSTSPFGKTKRRAWSPNEKDAVFAAFGDLMKLNRLPSTKECMAAIRKYPDLRSRRPLQLKTWIDNQRKAKKRSETYALMKRKI